MTSANLNISVIDKRMLKDSEAASYAGLTVKRFKATCPVQPIELSPGTVLYDKRDLDAWIDGIKTGTEMASQEDILERL